MPPRSRPLRATALPLLLAALGLGPVACTPEPRTPASIEARDALGSAFARAHELEQGPNRQAAVEAYLALVADGLAAGDDGLRAALAGLDALLWRTIPGFRNLENLPTLALRTPGALPRVEARLAELHQQGKGHPLARAFLAQSLLELARIRGDADAATHWRSAAGLVQHASVIGPLGAAAHTGIYQPTLVETGPLQPSYPGVGPFAAAVRPVVVEADNGVLNGAAASAQPGLHAIVVDVEVPRAQRVWFAAQSTAGATLATGGTSILQRPYALGGSAVVRMGWVDAGAGVLRVVLRLAAFEDGSEVTLMALGEDGAPLAARAPAPGSAGSAAVKGVGALELTPRGGPSLELSAAALLAVGESRSARKLLEEDTPTTGAALLYARALWQSDDTPENRRIERARGLYERVAGAWPGSWEARLGSTLLAAARKGSGEGNVEALQELARRQAEAPLPPEVRAFEALTALDVGMRDVALGALATLREPLASTPLLAALEERVLLRIGAEAEARACEGGGLPRRGLRCLAAKRQRGDFTGALAELEVQRALRGSPRGLLGQELALRIAMKDEAGIARVYDAMAPGERTLAALGALAPGELRPRLDRDRASARDAPGSLPALRALLGDDPVPALEAEGRRAVDEDRARTAPSSAATLVLLHDERYHIAPDGLLRAVLHDVRKVNGTTDVEQGIGGVSFSLVGRDLRKLLRRRIHKLDGRILEPDPAAMASQQNADLSQLEPGDYVEQISEAWILPDRAGHLVIDTHDLLPERTGVRSASIEVRYPRGVRLARWSHPLLGAPEERDEGDTRVLRLRLQNASPRRPDDGAPRMDREVSLSFGTYTWADIGKHLAELLAALDDDDPYVTRWARQAAGDATGREAVERIVRASGKSIRVPQANLLSDASASFFAGRQMLSARSILELGQGSRGWVIYRALRALKIPAEIVAAEREPFSADPAFPPRPSRFDHGLVIARLPEGEVWIDPDLPGPPMPAGRVSPELRGRMALRISGEQIPVQGASAEASRDEVEIALKVDARGNAAGRVEVQLQGRAAQALVDYLERVAGIDRRETLRSVVLAWLPWATVDEVKLTSTEGANTLALQATVQVPSLAQGEGKGWTLPGLEPMHTVVPRARATTLSAAYASRMGRQSALAIDTTLQYRVRRRIELPLGWKPPASLPAVAVKHELFEASRSGKVQGSTLEEEFTMTLVTGTVAAEGYGRFAAQAKQADDGFLTSIRIAP